jgi:hypothetical protein
MGAFHPGAVYSFSFLVLLSLGALAGLGAAIGLWTWIGFVITDVLFADRSRLRPNFDGNRRWETLQYDTAIALSYILLAGLLVLAPLLATSVRLQAVVALRRWPAAAAPVSLLVLLIVQSVYVYFWAQSTAFLIRPLWTVSGQTPSVDAIQPLQTDGVYLAFGVAIAVLCRAGLSFRYAELEPVSKSVRNIGDVGSGPTVSRAGTAMPLRRKQLTWWARAALQAMFATLLLWGLLDSLTEAGVVFLLLWAIFALRIVVIPQIPRLSTWIRRIPLALRIALCVLISYQLATYIVDPAVQEGTDSFRPLVSTLLASLAVAAVLLPGPPLHVRTKAGRRKP